MNYGEDKEMNYYWNLKQIVSVVEYWLYNKKVYLDRYT